MGPLFQLFFLVIAYTLLALVMGCIFSIVAFVIYRIRGVSKANNHSAKAFLIPFILAPYFFVALIANILICIYVRNVDPPLTDYWSISVSKNYELGAIDNTDHWSFYPKGGGQALGSNISSVNMNESVAYGSTSEAKYYIFNRKYEAFEELPSVEELNVKLRELGVLSFSAQSVEKYYSNNRETGDLISLIAIIIFPLLYILNFFRLCLYKNA